MGVVSLVAAHLPVKCGKGNATQVWLVAQIRIIFASAGSIITWTPLTVTIMLILLFEARQSFSFAVHTHPTPSTLPGC
jgi:hypothetical protein